MALQCFIAVLVVSIARPPLALAAPPSLLPPLALAASGPRVSVVVVSLDAKAGAQQGALEGAALEALDRAARFTVLAPHDAFNPGMFEKRQDAVTAAAEKLKLGKQALDDLDNVKATESFTQAVDLLQESDLSRDFPALLDAWIMKAAGHATGGENGPAKKDMESVIALAPRSEFSPTFFPPDLLKFAEAQRKLATNAKGELLVRTEPAGARVWVDGAFRGISPVTIAGLSAGKHFVAASLGGYALAQSQVAPGEEVLSLAAAELGPGWKKAVSDIKKDPEGATRDSAAQALGKAARLDQVLLVVAKKSTAGEKLELIALRLETRDGHNAAFHTGVVSPGDPEALATFFDALTGRDAKRDGKDPVHHFKGGGSSSVKTIAGISLVGFGAAALATGTAFGVMALNNAAAWKEIPQTQVVKAEQARSEGRTFALVADVSFIVGALSAAGGTVLLLTNGTSSSAEPEPEKKAKDDSKRREADRRAA
ncbi:MAG: PEGA domain-containing protein, partial [Myxococcota bacterium]